MDVARMRAMEKRTEALEARIAALEELLGTPGGVRAQEMLKRYPRGLTKTEAAEEIGVTRATIYAMIADGRLKESNSGRVTAQSAADLLYGVAENRERRKRDSCDTLRRGADNK